MLFILGTQKSGTTWLRNILGCLVPVPESVEWALPVLAWQVEDHLVQRCHFNPDRRRDTCKTIVRDAFQRMLDASNSPTCDKSAYPSLASSGRNDDLYSQAVAIGKFYFPESRHLQIIRDPREVLVSSIHYMSLAGKLTEDELIFFGASWARCNWRWFSSRPDLCLRYEDLRGDFSANLDRIVDAAQLEATSAQKQLIIERYSSIGYSQMMSTTPGFFRKGESESWREELSDAECGAIATGAKDALQLFGYPVDKTEAFRTQHAVGSALDGAPFRRKPLAIEATAATFNSASGLLFRDSDSLRFFVFDDGFYFDINNVELAPSVGAAKPCIALRLRLDHPNDFNLELHAIAAVSAPEAEAKRWYYRRPKVGTFFDEMTLLLPIDDDLDVEATSYSARIFFGHNASRPMSGRILQSNLVYLDNTDRALGVLSDFGYTRTKIGEPNPAIAAYKAAGWTPLHFAAHFDDLDAVRQLIDTGTPVDVAEANGGTALHHAAEGGHLEIAEFLLLRGAEVNPVDQDARATPLDHARRRADQDMVKLLGKRGGCTFEELSSAR